MTRDQLRPGVYKVQINDEGGATIFNLSVIEVYGLTCVASYKLGDKPPRKSSHLTPSEFVNKWVEKMEIIC